MSNFIIFRYLKKNYWPLEKYTTNYNWKYVFKSQKTNKEVPNAISLIQFLDLYNPSTFLEFGSRSLRLTKTSFLTDTHIFLICLVTYNLFVLIK